MIWREIEIRNVHILGGELALFEMTAGKDKIILFLNPYESLAVSNYLKNREDTTSFGILEKILDLTDISLEFVLLRKEDCKVRVRKGNKNFDVEVLPGSAIVMALKENLKIFITEELIEETSITDFIIKEILEEEIDKAVEEEDFERAAELKKQLQNLN